MPNHTGVKTGTITIIIPVHFAQVIAVLELEQAAHVVSTVTLDKTQWATGHFLLCPVIRKDAREVLIPQINYQLKIGVPTHTTLINLGYVTFSHSA
jgi:hypothetical protein